MEDMRNECPTEILIELKEDCLMPSHIKPKPLSDGHKSEDFLKNEGHVVPEMLSANCKSILDFSPVRIKEKFCCADVTDINIEAKQDLKIDLNIDCQTGILVDLPSNSSLSYSFCNTPCIKAGVKMCHSQKSDTETVDAQNEVFLSRGIKNCRLSDDVDNTCCSESNEGDKESAASNSGFKTPSPQSMLHITSEVSKVIDILHSAEVLDDDVDLLNEEILPIPLNFDLDDDSVGEKQLPKIEDACENEIKDCEEYISIKCQAMSNENIENIVDINSHHDSNENLKVSSKSKSSMNSLSAEAYSYSTDNATSDENSKEESSEIKYDSCPVFNNSASPNSADDVFFTSCISNENKENTERKYSKTFKTSQKKAVTSGKAGSRETLKNLSNINPKSTVKNSPLRLSQKFHSKQKITPQAKMTFNSKLLQPPSNGKLQLKAVSVKESGIASKRMSLSNTFHFQSSKEFISSLQRPSFMDQNASLCPESVRTSYLKKENLDKIKKSLVTPSKRYSISTPLKGTAPKPQFTPLLQNQNHALPRLNRQSIGGSCLSFSKSLQPSSKISHFSVKQQQCPTSSKLSQPYLGKLNSTKPGKTFGQGVQVSNSKILEKRALSTSNVKRFCSKLNMPSPSSAVQAKRLARELFPSDS